MSELQWLEPTLERELARMGLGPIEVVGALRDNWEDIAGLPWAGNSEPLGIRNRELVVEARLPSAVRLLSYAVGDLLERIDLCFGPGQVQSVRIVARRE